MKRGLVFLCAVASLAAAAAVPPHGRFEDGMLSRTSPRGWLREFCEVQRTGLTGHPEALSYPYDSCLWAGRITRSGNHGAGWWRYEQTGYYTDGLLRLGYALGDRGLIAKGEKGVDWTLEHQTADGELGDPCVWDRKSFDLKPGRIMWPMAVFFRAMKAKFDATGDRRIVEALARYFVRYDDPAFVGDDRNAVNVEGILWTYSQTGDRRLLSLAEGAWKRAQGGGLTPAIAAADTPFSMHGVTFCEGLKIPMILYAYTGDETYAKQAENALARLKRDHLLADGCPQSVESMQGNSVHWGHETCDVSDFTWSLGYFLEAKGSASAADLIERCVFNAGPGAVTKDFRALQYFSNLNQFIATSTSDHNPFFYGSTWMQYRPTHETECCAGNVHRFMPNYVSRMWLKDRAGDPVAALYGPSEVDYGFVRIREETDYPFDGRIRFVFSLPAPREFSFTYRVPGWCASRADRGTFVTVRRTFADGDVLDLDFPMEVAFEETPRRFYVFRMYTKHVTRAKGPVGSQGTVVRRGPLLFALPIAARAEEDTETHANMRGKRSANADFKCWNLTPASPFNYALAAHRAEVRLDPAGRGFDPAAPKVAVEVPVRRIRWDLVDGRFTPDMPDEVEPLSAADETVRLVPYGATTLRLTVFPELKGQ